MKKFKLVAMFLSVLFCVFANALPLQSDPAAMAGFKGLTTFNYSDGTSVLNVDVEYAVFAPGNYPVGSTGLSSSNYIYAYQVFNKLPATNAGVDFFSVGIPVGGNMNGIGTDATYGTLGGVNPTDQMFPRSASYIFVPSQLLPGQHSTVLLFSSKYQPIMRFGSVTGDGLSDNGILPTSSIPEPATMALLIPAILALRNRRNSK
ncbi:MAG TPA: hypothetical protein DDW84_04250 [Phycisphaerales bacterium]|nr:MAG: hypothetical protein A2Y13_05240 [Planctomycetes bacterium GWC2_45_44]HBG78047.1 hypothetical protein [Phycisphaerales bacterium]HBR20123.1 hypothetical protein [Phycisphaerales bacterium]